MQKLLAAAGVATVCAAVICIVRRRRLSSQARHAQVLVAACDLDKTVYPPAGPDQARQLKLNVSAMAAFEELGGFVFPVTGNNIPQAQVKFTDAAGGNLRELCCNPGIFCNGSLVLGPGGAELERHSPGHLRMSSSGLDFVTALLDFWDAPQHRSLLEGVGLLFFMPDRLVCVEGYDRDGYANVVGFCKSQRVSSCKLTREQMIAQRELVLQVVLLFPPLATADAACYEASCKPWQHRVRDAMEASGLMACKVAAGAAGAGSATNGVGESIKLTIMKDPWPEMDICVGGVDKGSALARFLQHPAVLRHLGAKVINPAAHVAVFGDAANDVPMFQAIGGAMPAMRVGMPHATHQALVELSTHRAEVSEALGWLCEARRANK